MTKDCNTCSKQHGGWCMRWTKPVGPPLCDLKTIPFARCVEERKPNGWFKKRCGPDGKYWTEKFQALEPEVFA